MDISLLFPLLILLLFIPIFLSGRKQRAQMKEMQQLQASVEPGDTVVTTSGLRGTIVDASYEDTVDIEIADGIVTTWVRGAIREKVNPGVADDDTASEDMSSFEGESSQDAAPSLEKSLGKDDSSDGSPRS